ncbi:GtrA family protein [Nocardioides sp. SYSU D00038]|uniref:GtrA family protein n=1 Tax=Nocardioides sp. SYSU D00038 TaxID=2812554 RepID=UPI0019680868|nr:GtrA family protein [Nocardioides sp. SYSU D00038]
MPDRFQRLLREAGRFIAVGGAATLVALFLFNLLVHGFGFGSPLRHNPFVAYVVANTVGMFVSYHGSRSYAFRDRTSRYADGGMTAYAVINFLTMLLPIACLGVSRNLLGLDDPVSDNLAANVIGGPLGLMARFYLFRTFVFHRPIAITEIYDEPDPSADDVTAQA